MLFDWSIGLQLTHWIWRSLATVMTQHSSVGIWRKIPLTRPRSDLSQEEFFEYSREKRNENSHYEISSIWTSIFKLLPFNTLSSETKGLISHSFQTKTNFCGRKLIQTRAISPSQFSLSLIFPATSILFCCSLTALLIVAYYSLQTWL
jgi:hypothetical protein